MVQDAKKDYLKQVIGQSLAQPGPVKPVNPIAPTTPVRPLRPDFPKKQITPIKSPKLMPDFKLPVGPGKRFLKLAESLNKGKDNPSDQNKKSAMTKVLSKTK